MTKKPLLNGIAAFTYIVLIASVMNFGTKMANKPDTLVAPIAIISLFTMSAAVMGYIFCYQPFQLYFDGHKKDAVKLFLQTTLVFSVLTSVSLALLFSSTIRF
jgi:hypothetical protein